MKNLIFSALLIFGFSAGAAAAMAVASQGPGINKSDSNKVAGLFDWLFGEEESEEEQRLRLCLESCKDGVCIRTASGFVRQPEWKCKEKCQLNYANSRPAGLFLAAAGAANPFKLLQAPEPKNKAPLMLADDYSDCMDDCTCRGGSSEGCDEVCEYRN